MDDRELVESQGACAVPKWGPKKGIRYEVDDFIVSPPSNEDGGFFHLRYGRRTNPRPSTYERINQELSMTVEIKDGDPVIKGLNLTESPEPTITHTGLSASNIPQFATPASTPETAPGQDKLVLSSTQGSTKPLYVFRLKDSKSATVESPEDLKDFSKTSCCTSSVTAAVRKISLQGSGASELHVIKNKIEEQFEEQQEETSEHYQQNATLIVGKENLSLSTIKLVDKVQALPVTSPEISPAITPVSATPISSPTAKRKISGVVMEQPNVSSRSYFFTKPFQGTQVSSDASALQVSTTSTTTSVLSSTSAQMSQQMENASLAAIATETVGAMGKKRRPKPSKLREMNFWAPTSM